MSIYGHHWRKIRARHLALFPMCTYCAQLGRRTPATVVDHITPHRGDSDLFYDLNNLQSLCKNCHDSHKQALEKGGYLRGSDPAGIPLDHTHPWFRDTDE